MKRAISAGLMVFLGWVVPCWADQGADEGLLAFLQQDAGLIQDVSFFAQDVVLIYSQELRRGTEDSIAPVHPADREDLRLNDQRREQARILAGQAFRSVLEERLQRVRLLHDLRDYAHRLTSIQLHVSAGDFQIAGPLNRLGAQRGETVLKERQTLSLRSGMRVVDSHRPAFLLRADVAELNSRLLYDPFQGGQWRFSVGRTFATSWVGEMDSQLRFTQNQDFMATLSFNF